ncbi:DeoR/GlpR family DNA-binding transcription regulator [Anaerosinus massiliensis]|uniref:DeoR/GlpR family DNA-binding transcription regulator n=1 Tax=Massilibacillus massiliensis TaxID=1806837 RepID=UPI000AE952D6|nr:DeoR/GlpR family DNA-binding transcription regulator [Massilibacillus massiliensis]
MIPAARKQEILNMITEAEFISAADLAENLTISLSTVRRGLIELEEEGLIVRTRGGASTTNSNLALDTGLSKRAVERHEEKIKIGKKAAELIRDAGCIILDAGTTTLEVARNLYPQKALRVITDSIEIAYELRNRENVIVIMTGGVLKQGTCNLYDGLGEEFLKSMHAQICVMGAIGFSLKSGLTKHEIESLGLRKKMLEISIQIMCIADSSKFKADGLVSICPADLVDVLITDAGISPNLKRSFEEKGIKVIVV